MTRPLRSSSATTPETTVASPGSVSRVRLGSILDVALDIATSSFAVVKGVAGACGDAREEARCAPRSRETSNAFMLPGMVGVVHDRYQGARRITVI